MELNYEKLVVKQKVEMLEAITSIETKNKYEVYTIDGEKILSAFEQSNWFLRILLKRTRAMKISFLDNQNQEFIRIEKKFAFFYPDFEIFENNILIGKIKTRFGINSKIEILDNNENLIYYSKNQVMHPWTFNIFKNKVDQDSIGLISKKWSGLGKEIFTDSDNFLIEFNQIKDEEDKKRILALSIIIDLFVFENH